MLTPMDAYNRALKLDSVQTTTLIDNINIRGVRLSIKLSYKLNTLYASVTPIRYDDPEPIDLSLLALDSLGYGKTRIVDVIINTLGVELAQFTTNDPCSSTYTTYIPDRDIQEFLVVKMKRKQRRYRMKYGGYEEVTAWGLLIDNKGTPYLAKLVYDHSYDIRTSSTYISLTLLPIVEKIELEVVREGTRVMCGPDGYAEPYKSSFTYVFPPA